MIPDGEYTAVVDRIEAGVAALELDLEDGPAELRVEADALPERARRADAVLAVVVCDGDLVEATHDEAETERRRERAQDRFDRLSRRPPRDDTDEDPE